jgi:hypothetical protein
MIALSSGQRRGDEVFDRPLHLAGVLDNAADELGRTWLGYEWNDRARCNCGFVARQVMRTSAEKLKRMLPPIYENGEFRPTWSSMTQRYCPESGMSRHEVFEHLFSAGLRRDDFFHLEELSHPAIVQRMTQSEIRRSRKSDVIAYLRAWAAGIEEFRDASVAKKSASEVLV